jgi:hypothetical protein
MLPHLVSHLAKDETNQTPESIVLHVQPLSTGSCDPSLHDLHVCWSASGLVLDHAFFGRQQL